MKRYAVIVAGGKGIRMESQLPKQFMLLLEVPVLMHTIERFAMADENMAITLVLPSAQIATWKNMCRQMDFDIPHEVVGGGESRYDSVKNGLDTCPAEGLVAIHDGVRPLAGPDFITMCFDEAKREGSALPVLPVTQSLRIVEGDSSRTLSREGIVEVQTPQCFDLAKLKPCYGGPSNPEFTDDATVFESFGNKVHLVKGEPTNIKITTSADLKIAEAILGMWHT